MHSLRQWRETWVGGWWLCREGGRQDKCTGKEKEAFCGGVGGGCGSDMNGGRKGGGGGGGATEDRSHKVQYARDHLKQCQNRSRYTWMQGQKCSELHSWSRVQNAGIVYSKTDIIKLKLLIKFQPSLENSAL